MKVTVEKLKKITDTLVSEDFKTFRNRAQKDLIQTAYNKLISYLTDNGEQRSRSK